MKTMKHKLLGALLLCATVAFSQSRTQKSTESFKVNSDVIVEINTQQSDVVVEYWNKNEVLVETVLTIDGVTVDEAKEYFDSWKVEALGNSGKVIITSRPSFHDVDFNFNFSEMNFDFPEIDFPEIDFPNINFEPVIAFALKFDSVSFPSPPEMPNIMIKHLKSVEWDQKAYEKDKEKYLKIFEQQMEVFEKEMEESFKPQMKKYEKKMEKWEKEFTEKYEPQMKEYEKEMKKWEKEMEPKLKAHEKEMEKWQIEFEKNIEPKLKLHEKEMKKMEKEIEAKHKKVMKMKKKITVKLPKNARVKLNTHEGSIKLPKDIKKV